MKSKDSGTEKELFATKTDSLVLKMGPRTSAVYLLCVSGLQLSLLRPLLPRARAGFDKNKK